ncbi:MAG: TraR/DksA family transcriptional regulator [Bacteroidia bacterium]|nr:TraR/DksA family transcriptional regulator [Bacteroidia bacterium]
MTETNKKLLRYSDQYLADFEAVILQKLSEAQATVEQLLDSLESSKEHATSTINSIDDYTDFAEKEYLFTMIQRQERFIYQLKEALVRVKNKTYGICKKTGELIDKRRLLLVPHTALSLQAKA